MRRLSSGSFLGRTRRARAERGFAVVETEYRAGTRLPEHAHDRPVSFQELFATLYHNHGIDVRTATVTDRNGRPQYLVDSGVEPIRELV